MNFMKSVLALMLVSCLAFACKSEKKDGAVEEVATESAAAVEDAADDTADAAEEVASDAEDSAEDAAETTEDAAEATEDAAEAVEEASDDATAEKKKLSVVYPRDSKLAGETEVAIKELFKSNPTIEQHFYDAYGFAVFPKIGKGGLGVGGAGGKGLVFENYKVIGGSKMSQVTIGAQAGGQTYQEVVFFENKAALDKFIGGKTKFSGQASAVALKDGASVDMAYQDGVAVFTKAIGGLMAEASLGGQKFKFEEGVN